MNDGIEFLGMEKGLSMPPYLYGGAAVPVDKSVLSNNLILDKKYLRLHTSFSIQNPTLIGNLS